MRDFSTLTFHPTVEKIVDIMCAKTLNKSRDFFRVTLNYYLAKMAATMQVKIATQDKGILPVNLYAINLAPSGFGKTYSATIIEDNLLKHFKTVFMEDTFKIISEENLAKLALRRAVIQNEDEQVMLDRVTKEFNDIGQFYFEFDSATTAAIKQARYKLLMANIGALNLEIDEFGSNLLGNADALNTYIELYDIGKTKDKLVKNTKDNIRSEYLAGRTPANLLAYGTPTAIFDASKVEDAFLSWLRTGYARRCIFGYSKKAKKITEQTPEEIFNTSIDTTTNQFFMDTAQHFGKLANVINNNKTIPVPREVSILAIEYRLHCEKLADTMGEHDDIRQIELSHRYAKALKLAGIYAFIDEAPEVTEDHYYQAICMVERSGEALKGILTQDKACVKLAKYLGSIKHEVTQVDLAEKLPFFNKGSIAYKNDLIGQAITWGHKNHIIIKRKVTNGIEFIHGETLDKTNLNSLTLSYSDDIADGYINCKAAWKDLYKLTQQPGKHWINHHTSTGHRCGDDMLPGMDILVLDFDGTVSAQDFRLLMNNYKFLLYTTKRHTQKVNRFRVIMPLNYHIKLTGKEFRGFMANFADWLPVEMDRQGWQRCHKWLTHPGTYYYHEADKLIDARLFIPKTSKCDERRKFVATYQSMTNMERWFIERSNGNRNVQLMRYAFLQVDQGYDFETIRENVLLMNSKLPDKLKTKEIDQTIMQGVAKKLTKIAA